MHGLLLLLSLFPLPNSGPAPNPPAPTEAPLPADAKAELARANLLIANQRFREAVEALQRAVKLADGKCFVCLETMAAAHVRLNEPDAALADAKAALQISSSNENRARAYNQIGLAYAAKARHDDRDTRELADSEKAFRQALTSDPNLNASRFHLAKVLIRQRRDKDADAVLDEYLKREPPGPFADQSKALKANHRRATESFSPDFHITTLDGKVISLDSLRGKVVLLDFWATWCGPCLQALPELKSIRKRFEGQPFELISISVDREKKKLEDFVKNNEMTWPQYFDEGNRVAREGFGVVSFPSYFVLDGDGIVTLVYRGHSAATADRLTAAIEAALKKK
ncbi:MAG TPA: redoxin domain-containing protein [Thermoanaerobaculia bacterium]|nr:redoxin domain-containing protein [Thermoanaerobaculia bacterium]